MLQNETKIKKELDTELTDEIICPHCGYEYGDSWELFDDDGDHDCPECEKTFELVCEAVYYFSTYKKDPKNSRISDKGRPS
jgi:uncharacterized Zn-finger protein